MLENGRMYDILVRTTERVKDLVRQKVGRGLLGIKK